MGQGVLHQDVLGGGGGGEGGLSQNGARTRILFIHRRHTYLT